MKIIRMILTPIILFLDFITRPKPQQRSVEAQKQVDAKAENLALYQFLGCPFCVKVRRVARRLNVPLQTRDAKVHSYGEELLKGGGRRKVPCLRITEGQDVRWMYESNDINAYLEQEFGQGSCPTE